MGNHKDDPILKYFHYFFEQLSVDSSNAEVASSITIISAVEKNILANAIRCFSPPEILEPFSPIHVSNPSSSE